MSQSSKFTLPYEHDYTGHWEAAKRRNETKNWLKLREQELESSPIVPEPEIHTENETA